MRGVLAGEQRHQPFVNVLAVALQQADRRLTTRVQFLSRVGEQSEQELALPNLAHGQHGIIVVILRDGRTIDGDDRQHRQHSRDKRHNPPPEVPPEVPPSPDAPVELTAASTPVACVKKHRSAVSIG